MTAAALPLLILELTSENQQEHVLGLVAAAPALPALLFALPSGMSADRHDRRRLLIGSELVSGIAMALVVVLLFADRLNIALVVVLAFVMGSASVLFTAAVQPTVPTIVPDELLDDANGKLAAAADGTEFVGTPLGPLLFALAPWAPFLADAVTYGASAVLLRAVPPQPHASAPTRAEVRLRSGIAYLRSSQPLVAIWFALGALSLTGALVFTLLPVVLRDRLSVSVAGYGPLLTLIAFGSTAAGLCAKWIISALGQRAALVVGVTGNAVAYIVFGTTERWWVAGVALAAWGFSVTLGGVVTMTIRQRLIPGQMMGRVLALFQLVIAVGTVAGSLLAAAIGDAVGVGTVIVAAGVAQFAVLGLVMVGLAGVDPGVPTVADPEP